MTRGDVLRFYAEGKSLQCEDLQDVDLSYINLSYVDLRGANLENANLLGANLQGADLSNADLSYVILCGANLSQADLIGADLEGADLGQANLTYANLRSASLNNADLTQANLSYAKLFGTKLEGANLWNTIMDDVKGKLIEYRKGKVLTKSIIGYQKCKCNTIVKLKIPKGAIVFSINGDKCRTNRAKILKIENSDKIYYNNMSYRVGDKIIIDDFCCEYNMDNASGIHFFMSKKEALKY